VNIRSITAPNPGPFTLDGTRTYLLGETTVIDPGPVIDSHIQSILESMPKLQTILITHRHGDHAPAAIPLQHATGAKIFAPDGVLEDSQVARRLANGDTIDVEGDRLAVIATPGHTKEHVCFFTGDHDLFIGRVDALANEHHHPMPLLYYRRRYLRIERAATTDVEGKPER